MITLIKSFFIHETVHRLNDYTYTQQKNNQNILLSWTTISDHTLLHLCLNCNQVSSPSKQSATFKRVLGQVYTVISMLRLIITIGVVYLIIIGTV